MTNKEKIIAYDVPDKEKIIAYNEAIKRAEAAIKVAQNQKDVYNCIITIFPELKKSKDDAVRKALIKYFTLSDEHAYNEVYGVSYRDIVAWLEKQNEKKSYWSEEDDRIFYSLLADIRTRLNCSTSTLESYYNEQIEWIKSLKQRIEG